MGKKKKKLSDVSPDPVAKPTKEENILNGKEEIDAEGAVFQSILDSVTDFNKIPKKRQLTVYIDEDVAKKLDKLGEEKGKGAKSALANMLFKDALKEY